jgi:hypothetical protein
MSRVKLTTQTKKENKYALSLTPYYRSHHHFDEMREWLLSEGLTRVTLNGVREPGFGIFGQKALPL